MSLPIAQHKKRKHFEFEPQRKVPSMATMDSLSPRHSVEPELGRIVCTVVESGERVAGAYERAGTIDAYFVRKFGFCGECAVVASSDDNPCSLAVLMCCEEGDICVLLGTPDTVFAITETPRPQTQGHVFRSPIHKKAFMVLLYFKNGSLTRESVRRAMDTPSRGTKCKVHLGRPALDQEAQAQRLALPGLRRGQQPRAQGRLQWQPAHARALDQSAPSSSRALLWPLPLRR